MLDKIKSYWTWIVEGLLAIATLAFLFEKNKADTNEALIDNEKTQAQVDKDNAQVQANTTQLDQEEQKRKEIKKEADHDKSSDDPTTILSKR